jgi:hypothetical protein
MKNFFFLFSILFLISCGSKDQVISENKNTIDTITIGASTFPFLEQDFKQLSFPLNLDTGVVQTVDTTDRINYQQVRKLGVNFLKGALGDGMIYDINEFAQIDSLKQSGGYKAYLEKIDIGMTKTCIAYKIGVLNFPENSKLYIWGITNATYEACPFFSGTLLIGTFVNAYKQATLFNIAEISGGGDPPSMMNTVTTAKITEDGKIEISSVVTTDDLDLKGAGIEKTVFKLEANGNAITLMDSKKEVVSIEEAPKQN